MHPLRKFRKDAGFKEAGDLALVFTVNNSRKSKKFLEMRTVIYKIERGYDISRKKNRRFLQGNGKTGSLQRGRFGCFKIQNPSLEKFSGTQK